MQEKDENITKIVERLSQYVDTKGTSFNKIAKEIGISNSYFSKMVRNNGSLGEDIIRKILHYYDDINPEWLILGQGNMIKSKTTQEVLSKMYDPYDNFEKKCLKCEEKETQIETLLLKILEHEKEIAKLNREIGGLETELRILKNKLAQGPPDVGSVGATG